MTDKFFPRIDEDLISYNIHNNEYDSDSKTNSFHYSNKNLSMNNNTNYIRQNITLKVNQKKNNNSFFSLNFINERKRVNDSHNNNYTKNSILHSLDKIKNSNSLKYNENEK